MRLVDFAGYEPPHLSLNGGLGCPLRRRGPVSPNTLPEKQKNKTKGCSCSAWAADVMTARQNRMLGCLGPARARSAAVSLCTPKRPTNKGDPLPFDHLPKLICLAVLAFAVFASYLVVCMSLVKCTRIYLFLT